MPNYLDNLKICICFDIGMEVENGTETEGDVNVELKSQWRPSQSRKESILNYLLMGNRGLYTKVKEESDQEISNLLQEGRILVENKYAGVRTAAAV